jgi:signal transduction histidine kinase
MLVEITALLAMLVLAILLAWLVARSMARSLRDLRHGALAVAQYGLPQAVARLRDPALSTQLSPAQVASQIAEPLQVRSRDEFGQVAEAFNAVHLEAVRTAAEQAALRSSVSTMFVNLARRSQLLVDRLISHLDRLERGEEDPDRLGELFQLDHLATRMRRNDENLLVLAGADSTRVQRDPASLIDVLRAAQSEVEHYTRIEFGVVDRDLEIAAHAVNDLVHLVAELLDNATAFSPPDSRVVVEARRVGDRAVLYVEDRGLGLSPEQLADINERLATPPLVDVAVSRMMGLVVVSRLAARHGVRVELRPAPERGLVADVALPASALVPRALDGPDGVLPPRLVRLPAVGERLALESGRPGDDGGEPRRLPAGPAGVLPVAGERPPPPFPPPSFAMPQREQPAPAPASRSMPAWSDLTGASAHNGADPAPAPPVASPLPRRRPDRSRSAVDGDTMEPETRGGPPSVPDQHAGAMPPEPAAQPGSNPPPAWPPVAPETTTPVPTESAARTPAPGAALPAAAAPDGLGDPGSVDVTTELPIFRELESAWFRTRDRAGTPDRRYPAPAGRAGPAELDTVPSGPAGQDAGAEPGTAAPDRRGAEVTGTTAGELVAGNTMRVGPMPEDDAGMAAPVHAGRTGRISEDWRTAADDGWRAASTAADAAVQDTTAAGLPKRRPMAQLVPGGVGRSPASSQHRSPEAVRGLLSAYHRGVQRGREQTTDDEASGSGGPHSTPAGKEQQT